MESDSGMRLCNWFAGIDLDSRYLTATLGFTSDEREPRILGTRVFDGSTNGDAQALLRRSLPELGQWLHLETGGALDEVAVAVPGRALQEFPSSGEYQFGTPTLIDGDAIDVAHDRAIAGPARLGSVVQSVIRGYEVDGIPQTEPPVGVYASTLRVESTSWVARTDATRPLVGAMRSAGFEVGLLAPRAVASAHSTLTKLEQREGAILVMVGDVGTECATLIDSFVSDVFTVPLGTKPLEAQIARACNISPDVVKRLDLSLMLERMPNDPIVQRVRTVLSVWGTALFTEVRRRLDERNLVWRVQAGVVIAGSPRKFPGLDDQAARVVGTPARFVATAQPRERSSATTAGSFVTSGLIPLHWNESRQMAETRAVTQQDPGSRPIVNVREFDGRGGFGQALGRWLREFVPAGHYLS
ncbi:MAG: hypothetical protein WBW04_16725 [Nitrolancea sp.]